ncbi:MAG: hypothetical protein QOJ09_155 [Actinomycetota bacterium]|nr:hypothetical protein [Actinomycetota bacterium]
MAGDGLLRILALLTADGAVTPTSERLCRVSAEVTAMSGAGIMLMAGDVPRGSLGATDAVSTTIEDLQFSLGEGPCLDAYHQRRPVLEPDLQTPSTPRWPAFTPGAIEAGARAIFGFPLQVGVIRLGALNLYRDASGPLSDEQHADACVMADVAARAVIDMQAQAPSGLLAAELEAGANFQIVVHQASGMVSVQLGIPVGDALVRLRGYAFANDCGLTDVASRVVQRSLRFDEDDERWEDVQ